MNDLIERYLKAHENYVNYRCQIDELVKKYIEKIVGFAKEPGNIMNIGTTNPNEISWSIDNNELLITYSVYADKWLDYWNDDILIKVSFDDIIKKLNK
jgi:hypothetical protein